ncbi:hypothetical protein BGX31_007976 [Mortierella sp. GBA43]|nr:hypothetical protein BGX31_007976 [Mortierella sp. GBA43]
MNDTNSFNMDSAPSLTHSDVSSNMDESIPLEKHQAYIQAYGVQQQNEQLQREHQQYVLQQQGREQAGYGLQGQFQYQPHENQFWQTEKQQAQYPHQPWQQPVWPAYNQGTAPMGDADNDMPPSLTFSSEAHSTSSVPQTANPQPPIPHGAYLGPGGLPGAGEVPGEDQEDFFLSVVGMIPPEMTTGTDTPLSYYDYEKEFPQRKMLGRGGNGEIRLGFSVSMKKQLVLKSLQDNQLSPVRTALLFDKEVEVMQKCGNHDNIVQFYGIAIRNMSGREERYMVMEYYEMGDLVNLIGKPRDQPESPNLAERLFIALDIAQGLNHLYRCGFHHGDLHPKNVLIDSIPPSNNSGVRFRARLTDFGLRRIRDNPSAYSSQQVGGVWRFMAPERLRKDRPRYSALCDIFALGVIYWVLMAGRYPFKNNLTYTPGAREERVEGTPDWFHAIYAQAWSENPRERQQSLDEIVYDLQKHLGVSGMVGHAASIYADPSHGQYHHPTSPSGYYYPNSPSAGRGGSSIAGSTMVASPPSSSSSAYSGVSGTTSQHSQSSAQASTSSNPASKSVNPKHPRNNKPRINYGNAYRP